jgi:hypothetical protein
MQFIYILLIGIVVYYLVTRLFENYSTQEDFDPSLVPVSSIVTLAKVAQKLVDGGGTLTNPGNLTVTGNFTTKGQLIAGTPNISGGGMTVYGNLPWAHGGSQQTETSNSDGIQPYGVHFIHQNKSQGIGIGFDGIYKCGTNRDSTPDITLATTNHKGTVNIFGNINATGNLYLGNKTNSTGVYLYPDGTDGALSIRNTANTAVSSLRCGNITCGTINTNNNTITCGTINTNKNTITCGMVNSVEGLGGGGWLKTNNMLQISNIKDDNNNIQITCNDLNELKMTTGHNQNYRAADINCGKITCGSLTIKHNSNWDYQYELANKTEPISSGNKTLTIGMDTPHMGGFLNWNGINGTTNSLLDKIRGGYWTCPTSGLWTISYFVNDATYGHTGLSNITKGIMISVGSSTTTVPIYEGDELLTNGLWTGSAAINSGFMYFKLIIKF